MTILLDNVDADVTNPPAADIFVSRGGPAVVNIRADDFGLATVEVQTASPNDIFSRFLTLPNGAFSAGSTLKLDYLPSGISVRAIVTGTTGSSDNIFADILQ